MNKTATIFTVLLMAILIASCSSSQQISTTTVVPTVTLSASTTTLTSHPLTPSSTIKPSLTASPTRIENEEYEGNKRVEPKAKTTPTLEPTFTPVVLSTLPELDSAPEKYKLTQPSVSDLGTFLAAAGELRDSTWGMDWPSQDVLMNNIKNDSDLFLDAVVFSLSQPTGDIPHRISELKQLDWTAWYFSFNWSIPERMGNLYQDAVDVDIQEQALTFVDQGTIKQKDYQMTSFQIELDRDPGAEWLVQIEFPKIELLTWMVYDEVNPSQNERLKMDFPVYTLNPAFERKIMLREDLTGDGRTDVILSEDYYAMGTYFTTYTVYEGKKNGFQQIYTYHEYAYAYTYEGPIPSEIVKSSSLPELRLRYYEGLGWGCDWERVVTYRWPGGKEQKQVKGDQAPGTPECALARAASITEPLDRPTRLYLLESAVNRFNLEDVEQREFAAFAHYQLALLYGADGREALARKHLEALIGLYAENTVTRDYLEETVRPLLEKEKLDNLKVCLAGYDSLYTPDTFPGWQQYINSKSIYHSYPGGEPIPDAICPMVDMVEELAQKIVFDGKGSPEEAIRKVGLPVQSLQPYAIPGSDQSAWFVVIDTRPYIILAYIRTSHGFSWQRMDVLDRSGKREYVPVWLNKDVTGDGVAELVIALNLNQDACQDNGQGLFSVYFMGNIGRGQLTWASGMECLEFSPDLEKIMADQDGDGLSDFVIERVKEYVPEAFEASIERNGPLTWFTRDELMQMFSVHEETPAPNLNPDPERALFLDEDPSETRRKLIRLNDSISPDEPHYDHIIARYQYLIALLYELEGNTDEAIRRYLALARLEPQTFWSSLAAARLTLK